MKLYLRRSVQGFVRCGAFFFRIKTEAASFAVNSSPIHLYSLVLRFNVVKLVLYSKATGVNVTGPDKPEGRGFQDDALNKPLTAFSRFRAGILVL